MNEATGRGEEWGAEFAANYDAWVKFREVWIQTFQAIQQAQQLMDATMPNHPSYEAMLDLSDMGDEQQALQQLCKLDTDDNHPEERGLFTESAVAFAHHYYAPTVPSPY